MKRFFTYIAILALAVACNDELYGPEETPLTPDAAGSVEIAVSDVTDNSFKVTVTPSGNVAYYSYLVDAAAAKELSAETLFKVGYKGVAQGTVKYSAEEPSYTFEVKADPNTTYQIYAVAGSEMGFVSAVVNKSVLTTDTVSPAYKAVESEGHQVLFTFSETVKRNVEGGAIKVPYYASYSPEFEATAASAGEITVPEDSITVAGNQALIAVPGLPTGALYTISIPAGAFVDAVGQKLPGYTSSFVMVEDSKGNLAPAPKGFYGEIDYVELPMFGEVDLESFTEWDGGFCIPVESDYALADFSSKKFITVTYEKTVENAVETIVYTLEPEADYNVTSLGLVVNLPAEPELGADVTINIPAGALYDIFGNDCEEWEHTMKYSYGYTLEDILGTYVIKEQSVFDGEVYDSKLVIEKSDDEEEGNVMFTVYDGIKCDLSPIYAQFNVDGGTLTVPSLQIFGNYTNSKGVEYKAAFVSAVIDFTAGTIGYSKAPVVFNVSSPNEITSTNTYGVLLCTPEGVPSSWYDVYLASLATLAPSTETTSVAMPRIGYGLNASFVKTF